MIYGKSIKANIKRLKHIVIEKFINKGEGRGVDGWIYPAYLHIRSGRKTLFFRESVFIKT